LLVRPFLAQPLFRGQQLRCVGTRGDRRAWDHGTLAGHRGLVLRERRQRNDDGDPDYERKPTARSETHWACPVDRSAAWNGLPQWSLRFLLSCGSRQGGDWCATTGLGIAVPQPWTRRSFAFLRTKLAVSVCMGNGGQSWLPSHWRALPRTLTWFSGQ